MEKRNEGLTEAPVINGNEDENASPRSELSGAFWIVVSWGFSEWAGIPGCSGNYNSLSCTGCSRNQAQALAAGSWGRSENKEEIQELVISLSSNVSSCAAWLLEVDFKDGHLGSCGLKVQRLLAARKDFILSGTPFASAEAQRLVGDCESWCLSCWSAPWTHDRP